MILPQMIFWDWDKTLVEQHGLIEALKDRTLKKYAPEKYEEYKAVLNNHNGSSREIFEKIFGDKLDEAIAYFYDQYKVMHIEKLTLKEGAKEVLDFFFEKVPYMLIVSNKKGNYLRKEVEYLKLDDYFKAVVGAGDTAKDKPHLEPVRKAIEESKAPFDPAAKGNAWFVGDSIVDLQTAKKIPCQSVIINGAVDEFRQHEPDELFPDHFAFLKNLKEKMK